MPPLASYFKLALLGLTGNDVLFNLVQWAFFAFSILAAAALAARLVPSDRAGPWAALLVATIPMAVLQSTSTQNDVVVAGYLLAAAFFLAPRLRRGRRALPRPRARRRRRRPRPRDEGDRVPPRRPALRGGGRRRTRADRAQAGAGAPDVGRRARGGGRPRRPPERRLLVAKRAGPRLPRRLRLRGSPPLRVPRARPPQGPRARGFAGPPRRGSATGPAAEGGRARPRLVAATARVHRALGIGVDEPAISGPAPFSGAEYSPVYHEDAAPSTATFLVLVGATGVALARRSLPGRRAVLVSFALGWAAWLLVALFVRWMPWNARLQLPALVLLAIPAAAVVAECLGRVPRATLASLLVLQVLPAVFLNWSRPLLSISRSPENPVWLQTFVPDSARRSIFATSRWEEYFRSRPALQAEVEDVMQGVSRRCGPGGVVQLVMDGDAWEYALWVGARRFAPGVRLRAGAPAPGEPAPCAVVRTRCPGARGFCLDGTAPSDRVDR